MSIKFDSVLLNRLIARTGGGLNLFLGGHKISNHLSSKLSLKLILKLLFAQKCVLIFLY